MMYPVTTFVSRDYVDATADPESFQEPSANSTMISHQSNEHIRFTDSTQGTQKGSSPRITLSPSCHGTVHSNRSSRVSLSSISEHEESSNSVGHISHIPRPTPSRATYTVPSIINVTGICSATEIGTTTCQEEGDLFGMIKLKENDVCYTSGTIEWVGKKRSFPINSGFKLINDSQLGHETLIKRHKNMNKTYTCGQDKINECDCADVLPTVNAIVDHLNALHEAVDLVDLRINTLEDALSTDKD